MPSRLLAPQWLALPVIAALAIVAACTGSSGPPPQAPVRALAAAAASPPPAGTVIPMVPGQSIVFDCETAIAAGETHAICLTPTVPPFTATALPVQPTETPAPAATPFPTAVPTVPATATPPPTAQIEGVPICAHDPTKWHGLVERDGAGAVTCTYGHEHHDNPHTLDSVFGPPGAWWADATHPAQEISYPWQTSSSLGLENAAKHNVYKWAVSQRAICTPPPGQRYSFTALRVQSHLDAAPGALVRFHSMSAEAEACDTQDPTWKVIIRAGAHQDYGHLAVQQIDPTVFNYVPLPCDPLDTAPSCPTYGRTIENGRAPNPRLYPCCAPDRIHNAIGRVSTGTWYGTSQFIANNGLNFEDWGPVDESDPGRRLFYGTVNGITHNNSSWEANHLLVFRALNYEAKGLGMVANDSLIPNDGWTNRYGQVLTGSALPCQRGPDCIPLHVKGLTGGWSGQYRADSVPSDPNRRRDYDLPSPVTGRSLIQFPN